MVFGLLIQLRIAPSISLAVLKVGLLNQLTALSSFIVKCNDILFLTFSIVFPKTELFINLNKSFSNSVLASFLFFVLKSMYGSSQLDCL
jgi:hypothetical protein